MGTQARRERRKERNRAASKALTRSIRVNKLKQFAIMAVIAAAIIGVIAFVIITADHSNNAPISLHGG